MVAPHADALIGHVRANHDRYLDELKAWVAIPSISAQPDHAGDVRRSAEYAVERMRLAGLTEAVVLDTGDGGHPVAYGAWLGAPGKPTILIYGHHDVQPADPLDLWTSPPFAAEVRNGKIYGRGSVDDKGQCLMHLAAIEAHLRVNGALPLNVKVVIEGEEEIGSGDFPWLTTSLRGLVHWEITVRGPASDLHSGYYGGIVKNPLEALAQILAALKDAHGRIVVPGFYDDVRELSPQERAEIATLPLDPAKLANELGVPELAGESARLPLERMWFRPTLEVNGMYGGYQGAGQKTIVPSFAVAKVSARLVPHQDPARVKHAVTTFVQRVAPKGVRVEIEAHGDVRAVETSRDHPAVAAAARAMELGFGKPPVFIGTGGTIGPVSSFDRILHLPQVLIGVGLPDDAIHAPKEKFDLGQFFGGIETMTYLYDELARALK